MNHARNRQSMRRIVYKQGYLKKIPNTAKFGSSMKRPERRWFVFGVIGRCDPYLEYYENEDAILDGAPINIIFLESIVRVVRDQKNERYQNMFSLILKDRHLTLVAPSRQIMFDWCRIMESQFKNLNLLDTNLDGENDYVDVPGVTYRTPSGQNHPSNELSMALTQSGMDRNNNGSPERFPANVSQSSANSHLLRRNRTRGLQPHNVTETSIGRNRLPRVDSNNDDDDDGAGDVYENLWDRNGDDSDYMIPNRLPRTSESVNTMNQSHSDGQPSFEQQNENQQLLPSPTGGNATSLFSRETQREEVVAMDTGRLPEGQSRSYRRLDSSPPDLSPTLPSYDSATPSFPPFVSTSRYSSQASPQSPATGPASSYPGVSLVTSSSNTSAVCTVDLPVSLMPEKMRESLNVEPTVNRGVDGAIGGWAAAPPIIGGEAPPPYMPKGVLEKGANKSLKVSQMEKLQRQQNNPGGVKIVLKRIDCHRCLALVQCFGAIWIAGWNQAARPFLQTAFHVGDQLISVNGQVVENTKVAYKLIKQCNVSDKITLIVKRLPKARIFSFKRQTQGQDLGIVREGSTGEIKSVRDGGPASQQGLPSKSQTVEGRSFCNWYITEVNHRPVSLFFKDKEIEHRLNAVGLDISILVQPDQLIKEFKKQLKSMKKYKDFLVK